MTEHTDTLTHQLAAAYHLAAMGHTEVAIQQALLALQAHVGEEQAVVVIDTEDTEE